MGPGAALAPLPAARMSADIGLAELLVALFFVNLYLVPAVKANVGALQVSRHKSEFLANMSPELRRR